MKRNIFKIFFVVAVITTAIVFSSCSTGRYPSSVKYDKSYNYDRAKGQTINSVPKKSSSAYNNYQVEKKNRTYLGQKKNARKSSNYYENKSIRNKTLGQGRN